MLTQTVSEVINTRKEEAQEITLQELERIFESWEYEMKNVLVQVEDGNFTHSHLFEQVSASFYSSDIFIDGENTMASALDLPTKDIIRITQKSNDEVQLKMKRLTVCMSVIKSKPCIWKRKIMKSERSNPYAYF